MWWNYLKCRANDLNSLFRTNKYARCIFVVHIESTENQPVHSSLCIHNTTRGLSFHLLTFLCSHLFGRLAFEFFPIAMQFACHLAYYFFRAFVTDKATKWTVSCVMGVDDGNKDFTFNGMNIFCAFVVENKSEAGSTKQLTHLTNFWIFIAAMWMHPFGLLIVHFILLFGRHSFTFRHTHWW